MLMVPVTEQGLLAYGICQTGCNVIWGACYAAAGATAGTVISTPATPLVILACNAAQGTCMTACAAVALTPTI